MDTPSQKLELAANVAIICLAILLGVGLTYKFFIAGPEVAGGGQSLQPVKGERVSLPEGSASSMSGTLILALQAGCRFCTESAPFYRRLIDIANERDVKLVAVLPTARQESVGYLSGLGLGGLDVTQAPLNTLRISSTPTLILVDSTGQVIDFWIGKLPAEKETEVINRLITKGGFNSD